MSTILLPILPGSLSANYCFESWSKLLLDFSNAQKAVLPNVGSFYSRKDGGAGTSFYVKESGTGNTGWVAK